MQVLYSHHACICTRVCTCTNSCAILVQVSEEEKAVSYGCTINPRSESYCASDYPLPINPNRFITDLVNF